MARAEPKVPQLQSSFIKHLVQPLYVAYQKAGILPGEWVQVEDTDDVEDDDVSNDGDSDDITLETTKEKNRRRRNSSSDMIIYNVMIDNISKNHQKWLDIIDEQEQERLEEPNEDTSSVEHPLGSSEENLSQNDDTTNDDQGNA